GIEQRHRDDDHAEAFDEAAEHGVEHEQRDEKFKPRQFQADQELRDLLADAGIGDRVGEDIGGIDDEEDVAADAHRRLQRVAQHSEIKLAPEESDDHREQASDR